MRRKIRLRLNWNAQCGVCGARKARQLSLLFESAFVSAAHFWRGWGVPRVNGFHLALQTIVWYPFVYTCATVPEYESFLPLGIDTIFISVSLASSAQKDYTYLPSHITVRLHLTLQLGIIRDLFSPRAFVPQQCLCPTVRGPRDSVCVFIFLNRKQRNGSESEYTEKLQQYSKSLC